MAKEIGLKINITSQGQQKVITNLNDLEKELQSLDSTLKTLDFGSKEFKETARNIQTLRSRLEDVDKATEGFGIEKRLRAIAATTNILTGSFQALSGVITTLSGDEDTLKEVQEAEAKALNVLNIALGIRTIQEGLLESRVLARTAIEKISIRTSQAYIATAKGVSAVLKSIGIDAGVASTGVRALTTSLAAIGLPLLIVGITTLIDKFSELNITASGIKSAEDAYEDFNAELAITQELVDGRVESLELEGNTLDALVEKQRALGEEQQRRNELEIRFIDERQRARNEGDKKEEKRLDELIRKNLIAQIKVSNNIKRVQREITKFNEDEEKKRTDEADKQNKIRQENEQKALVKRLEKQKGYFDDLNKLLEGSLEVEADVLTRVNEIIGRQEELIKERTEFGTKESDKLSKEIGRLLFDIIPTAQERKLIQDNFLTLFTNIKNRVEEGLDLTDTTKVGEIDFDKLKKIYNEGGGELQKILGESFGIQGEIELTEQAQRTIIQYFKTIQRFSTELVKQQGLFPKDLLGTDETKKAAEAQKILIGIIEETANSLENTSLSRIEVENNLTKTIEDRLRLQEKPGDEVYNQKLKLLVETLKSLALREGEVVVGTRKVGEQLDKASEKAKENEEILNRLGVSYDETGKRIEGSVKKLTETEITNLTKLLADRFSSSEEAFTGFISKISNDTDGLRTRLLKLLDPQGLVNLLKVSSQGLSNLTLETEQDFTNLISTLNRLQVEIGESGDVGIEGYSVFNDIIKELLENLKKLQTENKKAQNTGEDFLDGLTDVANKVVEAFSNISGRISNIVASNNALLFQQLQQQEEAALQLAGDATERERQEQLKLQREFAKKRFDLEKKARIQELQFTLANSIASGAQAVIQALGLAAPPPIPQLYAGLIAGLTGVEVATINSQIRNTESSVFIGRRGGMIQGGTHEQGGVPALLEGGEFVMSRPAVDRFGDIVGQMNQSVGGRGLQIDDSRIVQAISSQNTTKTPIKTYVVYQDIKDTDKLNNRIQKLSRL